LRDSIDPGLAGAGLSYALQLPFSLNAFSRFRAETQNMLNHVERVMEYYKLPVEAAAHIPGSVTANWPENGRIEFRKFYLRYRPTTPYVLRNVSFVVEPRMKVGVVGRTGAGKSSLMEALFRIVEATKGQIFIDDVDIGKIGLMDLRSKLAIIPQDPTLFLGTVRSNLDPFGERSDADIWDALELCEMRPVIEKLGTPSSAHSSGLDADVAPQGLNFSVGQRQLLCMARALLRRSRILVMDEATASVDLETDLLIQRTVRTQFRDCTVITIAHRLDTVIDSDRVLVMDHGRVAEFASPRELLSKEGVFTSMVNDTGISKSASLRSMVFDKDDLPTT
jgi:ATP-binding cassette subfamily C (CFTR/MRP) protein 1